MLWQWPQFCAHSWAPSAGTGTFFEGAFVSVGVEVFAVPDAGVEQLLSVSPVAMSKTELAPTKNHRVICFIRILLSGLESSDELQEHGVVAFGLGAALTIEFVSGLEDGALAQPVVEAHRVASFVHARQRPGLI